MVARFALVRLSAMLLVSSAAALVLSPVRPPRALARHTRSVVVALEPSTLLTLEPSTALLALEPSTALLALDAASLPDSVPSEVRTFVSENAFLLGVLATIATRLIINEVRARIEKPILDEAGRRVSASLTPDAEAITPGAWAKLATCVALDAAGDASELLPVLGEFTDVAFAPLEAGLLKLIFESNAIAGFGFVEEILPFTDIVPTFTLSWCLATLWPTTPLAKRLLPSASAPSEPQR